MPIISCQAGKHWQNASGMKRLESSFGDEALEIKRFEHWPNQGPELWMRFTRPIAWRNKNPPFQSQKLWKEGFFRQGAGCPWSCFLILPCGRSWPVRMYIFHDTFFAVDVKTFPLVVCFLIFSSGCPCHL